MGTGKKARRAVAEGDEAAHSGLFRQVSLIVRAIAGSGVGRTLVSLIVFLALVIIATAYMQIRLNAWNKPFYDSVHADPPERLEQAVLRLPVTPRPA
jgi:ABC-type uncharacterized transport system fused permease/ATPase subunit